MERGVWMGVACAAACSGLLVYIVQGRRSLTLRDDRSCLASGADPATEGTRLGPEVNSDALRYQLKLRGSVDRIYEWHGPKPFEFNEEVVAVFDDMVSRSVPLYCEVIDLLLYWVQRYYQKKSCLCDLGCSTGTTLDVIAQYLTTASSERFHLVGVDNSQAMVSECRKKLGWAEERGAVDIHLGDILSFVIPERCSFVVMNYTLQFIPVNKRLEMLCSICSSLVDGGVLFLSEKVRSESADLHETCTWIYEDFKRRRGYSEREVARKKEALMNVLVPYSERELRAALESAGFSQVELVAKWNNFSTFVARKHQHVHSAGEKSSAVPGDEAAVNSVNSSTTLFGKRNNRWHFLESLFDQSRPEYLSGALQLGPVQVQRAGSARLQLFSEIFSGASEEKLDLFDGIARDMLSLPPAPIYETLTEEEAKARWDQSALRVGDPAELGDDQRKLVRSMLERLKPWKKGPLDIFGVEIDTEWRSDWKWERIAAHLPDLHGKAVCDLGCGNGYYMFRLLAARPRFVLGIDPNVHAWLEFQLFSRFTGTNRVMSLELMRGDAIRMFPSTFDCVLCLGVLYHTPDPVGMLRDIFTSMRPGGTVVVDCCGIAGDDSVALFPKKKYANMGGCYFLPTLQALTNWMQRANFSNHKVIWKEKLSTEEQRITEWAPMTTSLGESLDSKDPSRTVEGYPAPYRFYLTATKAGK